MGTILGRDYSCKRQNDSGNFEYKVDGKWKTKEQIKDENREIIAWLNWSYEVYGDNFRHKDCKD